MKKKEAIAIYIHSLIDVIASQAKLHQPSELIGGWQGGEGVIGQV